ncbi:MAG: YopX family protein [Bacteroidota bacterium]
MNREIKFRVFNGVEMEHKVMAGFLGGFYVQGMDEKDSASMSPFNTKYHENTQIMQYTGLKDKNGKEIYEGDVVRALYPYRTTQTHTGDNIPNGSYTEPMEAGIKTDEGVVVFNEGAFRLETGEDNVFNFISTLSEYDRLWDLKGIEEAIQWYKSGSDPMFDDPESGDLIYLMELAKVETSEDLCKLFSGLEIISNIYENPELLP